MVWLWSHCSALEKLPSEVIPLRKAKTAAEHWKQSFYQILGVTAATSKNVCELLMQSNTLYHKYIFLTLLGVCFSYLPLVFATSIYQKLQQRISVGNKLNWSSLLLIVVKRGLKIVFLESFRSLLMWGGFNGIKNRLMGMILVFRVSLCGFGFWFIQGFGWHGSLSKAL